jgi:hypothetical protein
VRELERWVVRGEELNRRRDPILTCISQPRSPNAELISIFDLPDHRECIPPTEYRQLFPVFAITGKMLISR